MTPAPIHSEVEIWIGKSDSPESSPRCLPETLIEKLMKYEPDEQALRWIETLLNGREWLVVSGTKSSWRPVTSGVPQGSIWGPILFDSSINDPENGAQSTVNKFADYARLGGVGYTPGCAVS